MGYQEYVADEFEHAGFKVKIIADPDAPNPRSEYDNFGRMVCWHSRYNLGDCDNRGRNEFSDSDEFEEWWTENGAGGIRLPLYLYDHSGITMNCGGFSCPWDSGQVGWIYATGESIKDEFGGNLEMAEKCLRQEVETYDQYLTGDVYGYVIGNDTDDDLESCWGFFGLDYCKQEAKEVAERLRKRHNEKLAALCVESAD